jgi:3-hydroxybutyryl-CoA dehydratase
MDTERPRGLYFEEFTLGQEIDSPARIVTETDVMQFADLSGDHNPLHTDAEYARATPYGERIAHGLLGLSIASGLAAAAGFIEGTTLAFTGLEWKFKAPIRFGDIIHLRARVAQVRPVARMGGGLVAFDVTVRNQRDEAVQQGTWTLLMRSRPTE